MDSIITLYHGSPEVIVAPLFVAGNPHNDFGLGFYCSESAELAKEWSCRGQELGVANSYSLDCSGLECFDLTSPGYSILNWLAVLLENRTFDISNPVPAQIREYILETFLPDYKSADIIRGYRADDSYFTFAKDFLNNTISLSQLSRAMHLGLLGEQVVLKSRRAFDALSFVRAIAADGNLYYARRLERDSSARKNYNSLRMEGLPADDLLAIDIVRNKYTNDDIQIR